MKRFSFVVALLLVSPMVLLVKLEGWLTSGSGLFRAFGQLLSLVPGRTGVVVRLAYYKFLLESCSIDVGIGFGTTVNYRTAMLGCHVTIGSFCSISMVAIADHVLIGSRVGILSGARQHDVSDTSRNITDASGVYERLRIGSNTWIGDGALVLADVGSRCVIAAGSVVFRQIPDGKYAMGNPARVLAVGVASAGSSPEGVDPAAGRR